MIFYSLNQTLLMLAAAIALDWLVGDPRRPVHPVIRIGSLIRLLESRLHPESPGAAARRSPARTRIRGAVAAAGTLAAAGGAMTLLLWAAQAVHPWLGYLVNTWFISTTIAVKGLKDAAMLVYVPLRDGRLEEARTCAGYIVGRDTGRLDEPELTRAAIETVAENAVDAFLSPLVFALLGGAPLAMFYRAANTLDSMVGYRSDRYRDFGWFSARCDDVLNWLPARLTGLLLVSASLTVRGASAGRALRAILTFARRHPSPNSGIPEAAVAGALGIELGGINVYGGVAGERARLGWPLRPLRKDDIIVTIRLLYRVSVLAAGGLLCALFIRFL